MRIVDSRGGKVVVEHPDGYTFVFVVHDLDGLCMDLESVGWPMSGSPPDAEDLEMAARRLAEDEARAQGWL